MKAFHVIISGDVQGVGYRSFLKREAQKLGICGWVKNRDDGTVEAVIQGEDIPLAKIIQKVKVGPDVGWVKDVDIQEEVVNESITTFQVLY